MFTQYAGYLWCNPDMAGFLFWLSKVNAGPLRDGDTQHAMVCSFITSAEYQCASAPSSRTAMSSPRSEAALRKTRAWKKARLIIASSLPNLGSSDQEPRQMNTT